MLRPYSPDSACGAMRHRGEGFGLVIFVLNDVFGRLLGSL